MLEGELGFIGEQGYRRAIAIGAVVGFSGPVLDLWEPILVVAGVILGEKSSEGSDIIPVPPIKDAPIMALAGIAIGIAAGLSVNWVRGNGQL